jgi:hypothetical protein
MAIMPLSNVAAAETWRGEIRCVVTPLDNTPLIGTFEMDMDGTRLSYARPVHIHSSASLSGVMERGSGTLTGSDIQLQGGASGPGYSYTAAYQGRVDGDHAALTGEQLWTARALVQPFHRGCRITLTH